MNEKVKKAAHLAWKIFGILFMAAVIITAIYIMANHMGLVDGLDFGAGAYFYADIPNFEKYVDAEHYKNPVPMWVLILLFLIWGAIMYRFWAWLERKPEDKKA